jgi:spore coat protein CotH
MKRPPSLLWLALMFGSACDQVATDLDTTSDAGPAASEGDAAAALSETSVGRVVYDPMRVAKIEIDVGETDRETLRAEANQQINSDNFTYVVANVKFDGQLYEMVGLRVKGNSSRRASADNPDAIPYKLDMNKFVEGQKLDGLTKINLHRNASLNEYLSYGAFRKAGTAASRTGWADVTLNGASLGLYTLVEQVDERMLESFYAEPDGELYKPEPPIGYLTYSGDDIAAYGDVGYKADQETDHATFLKLVRTINEEAVTSWDAVLDVDSVLQYFAGNVALGNWDTYVAMGHNYYLFEATPGHMTMLPWDLNLSQAASSTVCPHELRGGGPGGGGPRRADRGDAGVPGEGFMPPEGFVPPEGFMPPDGGMRPEGVMGRGSPGGGGPFGGSGNAPLYTRLMQSEDGFARYVEVLKEFMQGPGSADELNRDIDAVVPVLGERLTTDAVTSLRADITARLASLESGLETITTCASETTAE